MLERFFYLILLNCLLNNFPGVSTNIPTSVWLQLHCQQRAQDCFSNFRVLAYSVESLKAVWVPLAEPHAVRIYLLQCWLVLLICLHGHAPCNTRCSFSVGLLSVSESTDTLTTLSGSMSSLSTPWSQGAASCDFWSWWHWLASQPNVGFLLSLHWCIYQ